VLAVSEHEIAETQAAMALAGFYIEPTAAVAAAGVRQLADLVEPEQIIVTAFTGHGLKHAGR